MQTTIAPPRDLTPGERFEHPTQLDMSWHPGAEGAGATAPPQLCEVTAVADGLVRFRHVVDGSLWGSDVASQTDLRDAKRVPRT